MITLVSRAASYIKESPAGEKPLNIFFINEFLTKLFQQHGL